MRSPIAAMRSRAGPSRRTRRSCATAVLRNGTARRFAVIAAHRTLDGSGRFLRSLGTGTATFAIPVTAATAAVALRTSTQLARTRPRATAAGSIEAGDGEERKHYVRWNWECSNVENLVSNVTTNRR